MRFVKCTISKPSLFDNKLLEFADGITLIKGKNGSGKSYLAKALVESIWRCFSKNSIKSAGTDRSLIDDVYVDICFALNEKEHEKLYRFRYQADTLSVFGISDTEEELSRFTIKNDELISPSMLGDGVLESFISKNGIKVFLNASFVPSSSDLGLSEVIDYDSIRDIILNDGSGFYDKYLLLHERYLRGADSNAEFFSVIDEQQQILNSLNKELEIIHIKNQRFEKLEKERGTVLNEISSLKEEKAILENREHVLEQILADIKQAEKFNEQLSEIKNALSDEQNKAAQIKALEKEIEANYKRFNFAGFPDNYLDQVQTIFREIIDNNEKHHAYLIKKRKVKKRLTFLTGIIGAAVVLSLVVFSAMHSFVAEKGSVFLIMLLLISLICMAGGSVYYLIFIQFNKKNLKALINSKEELDERLRSALKENSFPFDDYKLNELYDVLLTYFEDYTGYNDNLSEINTIKLSMTGAETVREIKNDMKILKNSESLLQNKIKKNLELINLLSDSAEVETIISYIGETKAALLANDDFIKAKEEILLRIEQEKLLSREEDNKQIVIKQAAATELLTRLTDKKEAVYFMTDIMTEAVKRVEEEQLQKLIDSALFRFHFITDNQFKNQLSRQTVDSFISSNGNLSAMNPSTAHILLLSVKLALTEFMPNAEMSVPLILDDPFLLMDDDRIGRLLEQLREIAKSRQIAIFTHRTVVCDDEITIEL